MGVRRGWGWGWKQLTPTLPRAPRTVAAAGRLVVVHVDALQLQVGVAVVGAGGVDAVLIGDDLPELRADLVTALATLDCNLRRDGKPGSEGNRLFCRWRQTCGAGAEGGRPRGAEGRRGGGAKGRGKSAGLQKGWETISPGSARQTAHKLTHRDCRLLDVQQRLRPNQVTTSAPNFGGDGEKTRVKITEREGGRWRKPQELTRLSTDKFRAARAKPSPHRLGDSTFRFYRPPAPQGYYNAAV